MLKRDTILKKILDDFRQVTWWLINLNDWD